MRLDGRRSSSNVDDRRGRGGKMTGGIIGLIIAVGFAIFSQVDIGGVLNGDLSSLQQIDMESIGQAMGQIQGEGGEEYTPTAEEQELAKFASQILAGTEDVWAAEFKKMGREYIPPRLVLFTGSVQSGCGGASASSGPFYCSADQSVYIDLSFFSSMKQQLGADGDFAYAYVIAHEVGHHVQYLLGTLDQAHSIMAQSDQKKSNQISVRLELQADFFAGIWAYHDNEMFGSLEDGDIEEGMNVASKIGDDYLQKKARGYEVPDSFNHGRSSQRMKWLKKGLMTGDIEQGDTFTPAYNSL
ncbi:MAG: neutral zinc metallopeptidase [Bacteroidaceae bacterium]|nr:neutral zinc metallopeptidase [Bacteroidaceae bacterium]